MIELNMLKWIDILSNQISRNTPPHPPLSPSSRPHQCGAACDYRCSETSHKNPCIEFCRMCCQKCLCVPSGTYGNKKECPCYDNWKTKEGGPKCP
ncbi:gibberellin-regulated protein 12-like [Pyrus ussuriensis x Pyrus communis]|uniref:Gibberellin-regulated protein 12-like n=1 Tax=Pyrus ussuriensis x Pyrus communis TaxID=2448454 RepID=A0A5N5GPN2_9ROSA|nr:gibberellin-regulated protein 12-like [Pyrus ussuriensis x Pyrus communis]